MWFEIPASVSIGRDFQIVHRGFGVVIHPQTTLGNHVRIYPGVVIGRFDADRVPAATSTFQGVVIGDDVVIYPGAKIVGGPGITTIAPGSVIGPNAVVVGGTDRPGTWVGIPAKHVADGIGSIDTAEPPGKR